jgi:hypothetical protein
MKHIVFRILFGLVLIAAIAGIAFLAYNAGVAHGNSLNVQIPTGQNGSQSYPVYGIPYWLPFPFFGFGFFGLMAVLFLLFVAFGAFRIMLFGPRLGWHGMYRRYGGWGDRGTGEGIPPMFAEMHRRMHAAEEEKSADQVSQKKE